MTCRQPRWSKPLLHPRLTHLAARYDKLARQRVLLTRGRRTSSVHRSLLIAFQIVVGDLPIAFRIALEARDERRSK